ncbi:hypothetical protein QCA50_018342 [Cerrena zonata]|uniref:Opaque-phase-specific protein OP4 n=1 Tax=Cerrena zonata TaxID=2478898 RepID=A0AAW0FI17_9APHY
MKFSTPTLLAILATTAFVSAAPTTVTTETSLVKKDGITDVLKILDELENSHSKRDLIDDEDQLVALAARDDSLLADLITSLANSGIIGDVWRALTNDTALRQEIVNITKKAIRGLIVEGPTLIKAVWDSGLIQDIFRSILNDSDLRSVLLRVARSLFNTGVELVRYFLGHRGSSTTTTATSTAPLLLLSKRDAVKRDVVKRDILDTKDSEYLDKRDVASVVSTIVDAIKNSGIVSKLVNKVLQNPDQTINFLSTLLREGVVVAEDIYNWSKNNGLLEKGLEYIENHGGEFAGSIASFLAKEIEGGNRIHCYWFFGGALAAILGDLTDNASATTTSTRARAYAAASATVTEADSSDDGASLITDLSAASAAEAALNSAGAGTTLKKW